MKLIHFDNYSFDATKTRDKLIQELNDLLSYEIGSDYNVAVYGVSMYIEEFYEEEEDVLY